MRRPYGLNETLRCATLKNAGIAIVFCSLLIFRFPVAALCRQRNFSGGINPPAHSNLKPETPFSFVVIFFIHYSLTTERPAG
jgi:hypothetical protein